MGDLRMIQLKLLPMLLSPLIPLRSVLISLFVYPPLNQSLVSWPASHLPPSSVLVFILASSSGHPWLQKLPDSQAASGLAWHHHCCFWHIQPQAITLSLCHSPSLNLFLTPNLCLLVPSPNLLYLYSSPAFLLSSCQMLAPSALASHPLPLPSCRAFSLSINPFFFYLPSLHPCPEIDKYFTFTLQ